MGLMPSPDNPRNQIRRLERLLAADARGLTPEGLVVMEPGRTYHTGTAAPALTGMFVEHSDRLVVPTTAKVGGIESGGTYMTGLEVFGAEAPGPMLLEIIGGHSTDEVLAACAALLKELVRRPTDEVQRWAVQEFLTGDHRRRAEALLSEGYAFLVPQAVLATAKLRLLLGDGPDRGHDRLGQDMLVAFLGVAGTLSADRDGEELWGSIPRWLVVEILQNQFFNATDAVPAVLARGRRLRQITHELAPDLADRLDSVFREVTGIDFSAVTNVGLALYTGTQEFPSVTASYFENMSLDPTDVERALRVLVADVQSLRTTAHEEFARVPGKTGFDWGYNTFRQYPAFKHPDGRIFVLHAGYLLDRCTVDAYELKVRMALRERARAGNAEAKKLEGAAGDLFGHCYEQYVHESLRAQLPELPGGAKRLWKEDELKAQWPGIKHCDFLADYGEALVAVEVVSKRLVEQTYGAGVIGAIESDIGAIVDKKVEQLDSTVSSVLEHGADLGLVGPKVPVFPVIVSTGGFPWNRFIAEVLHERVASTGRLQQALTRPLRVLTLPHLEEVEALACDGGLAFGQLLLEANRRGYDREAIDNVIVALHRTLNPPKRLQPLWLESFVELGALYGMSREEITPTNEAA